MWSVSRSGWASGPSYPHWHSPARKLGWLTSSTATLVTYTCALATQCSCLHFCLHTGTHAVRPNPPQSPRATVADHQTSLCTVGAQGISCAWVKGIILGWSPNCPSPYQRSAFSPGSPLPPGDEEPTNLFKRGWLYCLCTPETKAMNHYKSLVSGIIRPSSSPAGVGFFFVDKKDGIFHPCIDYQGLNNISVKIRYPLPLLSFAFSILQSSALQSAMPYPLSLGVHPSCKYSIYLYLNASYAKCNCQLVFWVLSLRSHRDSFGLLNCEVENCNSSGLISVYIT